MSKGKKSVSLTLDSAIPGLARTCRQDKYIFKFLKYSHYSILLDKVNIQIIF